MPAQSRPKGERRTGGNLELLATRKLEEKKKNEKKKIEGKRTNARVPGDWGSNPLEN